MHDQVLTELLPAAFLVVAFNSVSSGTLLSLN